MVGQFLVQGTEVDALRRGWNVEVLAQLIFNVLDGGPGPYSERALATIGIMDVLDEDLEVEGGFVGEPIALLTHDDGSGDEL